MDLKEYLFMKRMSTADFARKVGVSGTYMRLITNKHKKPKLTLAKLIEFETGGMVSAQEIMTTEPVDYEPLFEINEKFKSEFPEIEESLDDIF